MHRHRRLRRGLRRRRRHPGAARAHLRGGAPSPGDGVLAPCGGRQDAPRGGGLRVRAGRRLRAGASLRPDRGLGDGRVRPAGDHPRDHPGRRRHPAPRAGPRQAAGDGAGPDRTPDRRAGGGAHGTGERGCRRGRLAGASRGARAADRAAAADRGAAREGGGPRRRRDRVGREPPARAPPVRDRDGHGGPNRGNGRFPREAPARVQGALVAGTPNVFDPVFDDDVTRYADYELRCRRARLGYQAGSERLGLSLWELEPGSEGVWHYHFANEELLAVLSGGPTLRTPAGSRELAPGEVAAFPRGPHGAHAIANHGQEAIRVAFISEMRGPEVVVYPDDGMLGSLEEMSSPERGGMAVWTVFDGAIERHDPEEPDPGRAPAAEPRATNILDPELEDVEGPPGYAGRGA